MARIGKEYLEYLEHFGRTVTVRELACQPNLRAVALRHDVDHDIDLALEMAWLESDHGLRSSYFILHTAPYFAEPLLEEKCKQIAALGHEVAFHNNLLAEFLKTGRPPDQICTEALARMRSWGVRVDGVSGHGDPLCYERGFLNQCFFREGNAFFNREGHSFTAEGDDSPARRERVVLSGYDRLQAAGRVWQLGSVSLADFGIVYDANLIPFDAYYSDSRGKWNQDPLHSNLQSQRCQVNMHPEHYAAPPRTFFILGCARSGSKWLTKVLNETTTVKARHEHMLNHYQDGDRTVRDGFTGGGFVDRLHDAALVDRRIADWQGIRDMEDAGVNRAEVNVYLVHVLDKLRKEYPHAKVLHLHRNGRKVVNSLVTRGWYDTPEDSHHPRMGGGSGQLSQCASYWSWVVDRLDLPGIVHLPLEVLVSDPDEAFKLLAVAGIRVVLPERYRELCGQVVDPSRESKLSDPDEWPPELARDFDRIASGHMVRLGYQCEATDDGALSSAEHPSDSLCEPNDPSLFNSDKQLVLEFRKPAVPPRVRDALSSLLLPVRNLIHEALHGGDSAHGSTERAFYRTSPSGRPTGLNRLNISATPGCHVSTDRLLQFELHGPWKHWAVFGTSNWNEVLPSSVVNCRLAAYATTEFRVAEMQHVCAVTLRHLYFDCHGRLIKPYSRAFSFSRSFLGHGPACKLSTCPPERACLISVGLQFDLGDAEQGSIAFSRLDLRLVREARAA